MPGHKLITFPQLDQLSLLCTQSRKENEYSVLLSLKSSTNLTRYIKDRKKSGIRPQEIAIMVQNIPEEVALDTYNNDNEYHPSDKDTVHEKHEEQEMDSRSAASGKTESERIMTSSEGKKDKGPATYQLIFITIALVLAVFCVSLVSKYESTPRVCVQVSCCVDLYSF